MKESIKEFRIFACLVGLVLFAVLALNAGGGKFRGFKKTLAATGDVAATATPTPTETPTPTLSPTPTPISSRVELVYPTPAAASEVAQNVKSAAVIKVDGIIEDLWSNIEYVPIKNIAWGETGASGQFKLYWDKDYLYILVDVSDNTPDTAAEMFSRQDCVEVFYNADGSKPQMYGDNDMHFKINRAGKVEYGNNAGEETFKYGVKEEGNAYKVEIGIPFADNVIYGKMIGLDIRVNDSKSDQFRDYMIQWSDTSMYTYDDLSLIGSVNLK